MKLYNIPQGSKLKVLLGRGSTGEEHEEIITFHHLDGMYSYCTADADQAVLHLSASTPLIKVGKYYKLKK